MEQLRTLGVPVDPARTTSPVRLTDLGVVRRTQPYRAAGGSSLTLWPKPSGSTRAGHATQRGELASVEGKIAETKSKIDRYLTAFENGTLDDELAGAACRATRHRRVTGRAARRTRQLPDAEPTVPSGATLAEVAGYITEIISSGTDQTREALLETLRGGSRDEQGPDQWETTSQGS